MARWARPRPVARAGGGGAHERVVCVVGNVRTDQCAPGGLLQARRLPRKSAITQNGKIGDLLGFLRCCVST